MQPIRRAIADWDPAVATALLIAATLDDSIDMLPSYNGSCNESTRKSAVLATTVVDTTCPVIVVSRLQERMSVCRLTQSELARRVGVSPQTIQKLVSGESTSSRHLHKIARALETSPAYLTGETDDPAPDAPLPESAQAEPQMVMLPVAFPPQFALADMLFGMMRSMPDLMEPLSEARQAEIARELATLLPSVLARVRGPFRSERSAHDDAAIDEAEAFRGGSQAQRRA